MWVYDQLQGLHTDTDGLLAVAVMMHSVAWALLVEHALLN